MYAWLSVSGFCFHYWHTDLLSYFGWFERITLPNLQSRASVMALERATGLGRQITMPMVPQEILATNGETGHVKALHVDACGHESSLCTVCGRCTLTLVKRKCTPRQYASMPLVINKIFVGSAVKSDLNRKIAEARSCTVLTRSSDTSSASTNVPEMIMCFDPKHVSPRRHVVHKHIHWLGHHHERT